MICIGRDASDCSCRSADHGPEPRSNRPAPNTSLNPDGRARERESAFYTLNSMTSHTRNSIVPCERAVLQVHVCERVGQFHILTLW